LKSLAALPMFPAKFPAHDRGQLERVAGRRFEILFLKRRWKVLVSTASMFGGDWPVATLAASYSRWLETVQEFFSFAPAPDQTKLFQTNAERIYRV